MVWVLVILSQRLNGEFGFCVRESKSEWESCVSIVKLILAVHDNSYRWEPLSALKILQLIQASSGSLFGLLAKSNSGYINRIPTKSGSRVSETAQRNRLNIVNFNKLEQNFSYTNLTIVILGITCKKQRGKGGSLRTMACWRITCLLTTFYACLQCVRSKNIVGI